MNLFLSFLTVEVIRSYDHLGDSTGWTLLENKEIKLRIRGGIVGGIEYLDGLEYGVKRGNPYNNYVNPFYLFEILTEQGRKFFINYYADEIAKVVAGVQSNIRSLENQLDFKRELEMEITEEIQSLKNNASPTPAQ